MINDALRNITLKYNEEKIIKKMFKILDSDEDDYITFYDFGEFIQVFHIYEQLDQKNKGRLFTGELYDGVKISSGIPSISQKFKYKAKKLSLLEQDTYIDVYSFLVVIKMEEFVNRYKRKSTPDLLTEIELIGILKKFEYDEIPFTKYSECGRGTTKDQIKLFDWECAFTKVIRETLYFYEKSADYITAMSYNMTLSSVNFEFPASFVQ